MCSLSASRFGSLVALLVAGVIAPTQAFADFSNLATSTGEMHRLMGVAREVQAMEGGIGYRMDADMLHWEAVASLALNDTSRIRPLTA
jgi:hypothetical protein